MNFFAKVALEVINLLCNNRYFFYIAKRLELFDAVFVMYPANQRFADHYTFRWRQRLIKWEPFIVGTISHPTGKRTLSFAISSHLDEVGQQITPYDMRLFHSQVEQIAEQLGGVSTHFAGTLPGRLAALKVRRGENSKNERLATTGNVVKAIVQVRATLRHESQDPIIVLGSSGHIGKEVVKRLKAAQLQVVEIDIKNVSVGQESLGAISFPECPHLVVNITLPEAINGYVEKFNVRTALLNEVFPQPDEDVLAEIRTVGPVRVFHISGVCAKALPEFPLEYEGAAPCCAALQEEYDVKVIEL